MHENHMRQNSYISNPNFRHFFFGGGGVGEGTRFKLTYRVAELKNFCIRKLLVQIIVENIDNRDNDTECRLRMSPFDVHWGRQTSSVQRWTLHAYLSFVLVHLLYIRNVQSNIFIYLWGYTRRQEEAQAWNLLIFSKRSPMERNPNIAILLAC